jgi:hypothetical protein
MTRRWLGPVPEEAIVLGTPWTCAQCRREFRQAVASELGQRRCAYHPGKLSWSPLYALCMSCCGRDEASAGCTRCDHAPQSVWEEAGGTSQLFVPAYVLRPSTKMLASNLPSNCVVTKHRLPIERRVRLEEAFWNSLPSRVTTPAIERAQAQVRFMEEWTSATEGRGNSHTFVPFVRPPEERETQRAKLAETAEEVPAENVVELLVRPWTDERAWRTRPTDAFSVAMASEMRRHPVPWVLISLVDVPSQ